MFVSCWQGVQLQRTVYGTSPNFRGGFAAHVIWLRTQIAAASSAPWSGDALRAAVPYVRRFLQRDFREPRLEIEANAHRPCPSDPTCVDSMAWGGEQAPCVGRHDGPSVQEESKTGGRHPVVVRVWDLNAVDGPRAPSSERGRHHARAASDTSHRAAACRRREARVVCEGAGRVGGGSKKGVTAAWTCATAMGGTHSCRGE